jgi:hypothetical protein
MAKPIRATPKLRGEDANKFVNRMIIIETSRITERDKELAKQIKSNSKFFKAY